METNYDKILQAVLEDIKHQKEDIIVYVLIYHFNESPAGDIYSRIEKRVSKDDPMHEVYYLDGKFICSFKTVIDHSDYMKSSLEVNAPIEIPNDI